MVPPSSSTIRFVRARPNPVPSRLRVLPLCFAHFCAAVSQQPDFAHVCRRPCSPSRICRPISRHRTRRVPGVAQIPDRSAKVGRLHPAWKKPTGPSRTASTVQSKSAMLWSDGCKTSQPSSRAKPGTPFMIPAPIPPRFPRGPNRSSAATGPNRTTVPPGNEPTSWPAGFKRSPHKQSIVEGFAFSARTPTLAST